MEGIEGILRHFLYPIKKWRWVPEPPNVIFQTQAVVRPTVQGSIPGTPVAESASGSAGGLPCGTQFGSINGFGGDRCHQLKGESDQVKLSAHVAKSIAPVLQVNDVRR